MAKPQFCVQCGAQLGPNDQFCGQCGQPAPQMAPSAPPVGSAPPMPAAPTFAPPTQQLMPRTQAREDAILGIIDSVQRSSGFMGIKKESFNLIVYADRLLFAAVSKQMANEAVQQARQSAKSEGKGFFGQWGAQMGWMKVICEQYRTMTMSEILASYPGSFCIDNAHIKRIRFRLVSDAENNRHEQEMRINTTAQKHRFTLLTGTTSSARQVLSTTLSAVIR